MILSHGLAIRGRSCPGALCAALALVLMGSATDAPAKPPPPVVFGGVTPQGWPVVVEVSPGRRKVVRAAIGLDANCSSGRTFSYWDRYRDLPLGKKGRFRSSFDSNRVDYDDGTYDIFAGNVSGTTNRARTRMSGTWRLTVVEHDASGAVTDRCDSGTVRWKAKQ
jgi:hypothetical protein